MEDNWQELRQKAEEFRLPPTEADWNRVRNKLEPKPAFSWSRRLALAASVLLLLGLSFVLQFYRPDQPVLSSQLPDYHLERMDLGDEDKLARWSLDYTRYLRSHYPDMLETRQR
jgi:hypothetical protein